MISIPTTDTAAVATARPNDPRAREGNRVDATKGAAVATTADTAAAAIGPLVLGAIRT